MIIDQTFKRILKLARALSFFTALLYLVSGIFILLYNEKIEHYIYLIVGINLIAASLLDFMKEIVEKTYKKGYNHIGTAIFTMLVGIIILTVFKDNIYRVSVMWAAATVVNSTMEINEGIHEIYKRKTFGIINVLFAIAEIVFSILLLIEPEENAEHLITHIYLLGVGFILEALEDLIKILAFVLIKIPFFKDMPILHKIVLEREEEKVEEIKEEQQEKKSKKKK